MAVIIVNADDFGYSEATNAAILTGMQAGIISSTTILVNTSAFAEACSLAHTHGLEQKIGIHLNMTEGIPLTDRIRRLPRFCSKEGGFAVRRTLFPLTPIEYDALAEEFTAQITRCHREHLPLTHADSHHHIHTVYPIFTVVSAVLKQQGITALRISRNCGHITPLKRGGKVLFNSLLRGQGFITTQFFGGIEDFQQLLRNDRKIISGEIVIHPMMDTAGALIDRLTGIPLFPAISEVIQGHRLQAYPPPSP